MKKNNFNYKITDSSFKVNGKFVYINKFTYNIIGKFTKKNLHNHISNNAQDISYKKISNLFPNNLNRDLESNILGGLWKESGSAVDPYKNPLPKDFRHGGALGGNFATGSYKNLLPKDFRNGGALGSNFAAGFYKNLLPKDFRHGGALGSNFAASSYKNPLPKDFRHGGALGSNFAAGFFPKDLRHGTLTSYNDFLSSSSNGLSKIIRQLSDSNKTINFYNGNFKIPKNYLVSSQDKSLISEKRIKQSLEQLLRNRNLDFSNVSSDTVSTALDNDHSDIDNVDEIIQAVKELSNSRNHVDIEEQAKKDLYYKNTQRKRPLLETILRYILILYLIPVITNPLEAITDQEIENEVIKYNFFRTGAISPWGYTRCTNPLPVFSGHSLKSKILYRLPFKTKVKVIKQVGSWSQIKIKFGQKYSNYGWVRSKYLVIN